MVCVRKKMVSSESSCYIKAVLWWVTEKGWKASTFHDDIKRTGYLRHFTYCSGFKDKSYCLHFMSISRLVLNYGGRECLLRILNSILGLWSDRIQENDYYLCHCMSLFWCLMEGQGKSMVTYGRP